MTTRKSFDVVWTDTARNDLEAIANYIANDNVDVARATLSTIRTKTQQLHTMPQRGRIIPELEPFGLRLYRELIMPPWRIMYRISGTSVILLAVLDSRRNLEDLLLERFLR